MKFTLPVDRGDRVFVIEMLPSAFRKQHGKIIVRFKARLDPLSINKEQRQHMVFLDRFIEKLLLDVRFPRLRSRR